jgi:hypothetical protein
MAIVEAGAVATPDLVARALKVARQRLERQRTEQRVLGSELRQWWSVLNVLGDVRHVGGSQRGSQPALTRGSTRCRSRSRCSCDQGRQAAYAAALASGVGYLAGTRAFSSSNQGRKSAAIKLDSSLGRAALRRDIPGFGVLGSSSEPAVARALW